MITNGGVYGSLTVLEYHGVVASHKCWVCVCECGGTRIVRGSELRSGAATSCGCRVHRGRVQAKHGYATHPLYSVWYSMMHRCYNPNNRAYMNYGGRGISVCPEWHDVEVFIADMSPRPVGYSLDRIDNNKGYCKENCRWATNKDQQMNTRATKLYTHDGVTDSVTGWARRVGMYQGTLSKRLRRGVPFSKAIGG